MEFVSIIRQPDSVLFRETDSFEKATYTKGKWEGKNLSLTVQEEPEKLTAYLESSGGHPSWVILHWNQSTSGCMVLNDHWERSYGDLEWALPNPEKALPWYCMLSEKESTLGCGVMTGCASMAFWQVLPTGISLWLDVRSGGAPLHLENRRLKAAEILYIKNLPGESSFQTTCRFCKKMCPSPRMPKERIYGGNNWYTDYGKTSETGVLNQAKLIASLSQGQEVRPFMLVDDGWQLCHFDSCAGGPWVSGNRLFPDFSQLPEKLKDMGVRPGLWFRPLLTMEQFPEECYLPQGRIPQGVDCAFPETGFLDPSHPAVLESVQQDIRRFTGWGFEMIKHDFSTFDMLGRWGFQMDGFLTLSGWHFYDHRKTTAEIIGNFYKAIREAAGDTYILGCNTISHLSAGLFELNRTGDDTSGREWERTRKMGVNTLAFRYPHHNAFYAADADCIGLTKDVPWEYNREFLRLVAKSGTPLFLSVELNSFTKEQEKEVASLFSQSQQQPAIFEPLDWKDSKFPAVWNIDGQEETFRWYLDDSVDLLSPVLKRF
jgi:alpha-galactosidase